MSAAPGYTIHVSGLAPETTEEKLHDFFSFCGKLVSVKKDANQADITFEKLSAMRTSLMLNGGTLDGAHLEVTSTSEAEPKAASVLPTGTTGATPIGATTHDISQEDKPKAAIVAEYLAHGYVMGDHIVQRAIELDQKQGISSRFVTFINSIDKSVGQRVVGENQTVSGKLNEQAQILAAKTKEVDQNRGVSARLHDYFSKAISTPVGQKVVKFYTDTQKQVLDVHEEARRIADEKKAGVSTPTTAPATDAKTAETAPPAAGATSSIEKLATAAVPPP
ncbi:hypothetical protein JCM24511_04286 [Saitozyma sp. JCM 24511]|nr:hypothetical protein JCM24511_04286 [Saitozyma sp. JCM 24511]